MAALAVLEHYVTPVAISKGGYRGVMDACGTSAARGAVRDRCRARRDVFLHPQQKREILILQGCNTTTIF